jgi:hypothetical protein
MDPHPGEAAAFRHMQRRDESGTVKPDGLIIANQQRKEIEGGVGL